MRDTFSFYKSFYDAAKSMSNEDRLAFYDAVISHSFDESPQTETPLAQIVFTAIMPTIDSQKSNYANGKKGGRPKKESTSEEEKKPLLVKKKTPLLVKQKAIKRKRSIKRKRKRSIKRLKVQKELSFLQL